MGKRVDVGDLLLRILCIFPTGRISPSPALLTCVYVTMTQSAMFVKRKSTLLSCVFDYIKLFDSSPAICTIHVKTQAV
jgi:hypothetical protein